jgi:hypothetical protein
MISDRARNFYYLVNPSDAHCFPKKIKAKPQLKSVHWTSQLPMFFAMTAKDWFRGAALDSATSLDLPPLVPGLGRRRRTFF